MKDEALYVIRRRLNKDEDKEEYKLLGEIERGSSIRKFLKSCDDVAREDIVLVSGKESIHECRHAPSYAFIVKDDGNTSIDIVEYYKEYENNSYSAWRVVNHLEYDHVGPDSKIVKAFASIIVEAIVSVKEFKDKNEIINMIDGTVSAMSLPGYGITGDGRSTRFAKELAHIDSRSIYLSWLIKSIRLWLDASEGFAGRLSVASDHLNIFCRIHGVAEPDSKQIIKDFISLREYILMCLSGDVK